MLHSKLRMPYRRARKLKLYQTRTGVKHSDTGITIHGSGSAPSELVLMNTDVGARTTTGGTQNIQDTATTDNTVTVGSIIKYVNLILCTASRPVETTTDNSIGWLEYAIVCVKETETSMPITLVGTNTLMDLAQKMYRNECIWTGAMPVSNTVPNQNNLVIKIPKHKQKITVGDEWRLYFYYRDTLATEAGTITHKTVNTVMFKSYQ